MEEHALTFEDIRPYHDEEVHAVLQRITQKPSFFQLIRYLFPQMRREDIIEGFRHIHSTRAFQALYIHSAIRSIVAHSTEGLSYTGIRELDKTRPHLFLSNHRDIILDSAFLNILLFEHGYETSQIAIGDNLMVSGLVTDLMKLNKSFIVHRSAPRHLMLAYSQRLSRYIRHLIQEKGASVWLAQRNGRTKDGRDQTAPALLKMLALSGPDDLATAFGALHIVPMAVSYEYEPCDGLKAEELVHQDLGLPYEKDDKQAIIQGIRAPKGRVHLAVGEPLHLAPGSLGTDRNAACRQLAAQIDEAIAALYHRWPTHYIAADLRDDCTRHQAHYTPEARAQFLAYLDQRAQGLRGDPERLRRKLIEIYAGMVPA